MEEQNRGGLPSQPQGTERGESRRIERQALILVLVAIFMFGFGFALVPLYDVFCELAGLNGKILERKGPIKPVAVDKTREIAVEFTGSVDPSLQWEFAPEEARILVHPGESHQVRFRVKNLADRSARGRAVPSIAPSQAARFLIKTVCFCFAEQILAAREEKILSIRFYVDPAISKGIRVLTLAYAFYPILEKEGGSN